MIRWLKACVACFAGLALLGILDCRAGTDDSFPAEKRKWRCVKSPNFELYASGGSERDVRALAYRLEVLRALFIEKLHLRERRPLAVTVYAFDDDDDFLAYGIHQNYAGLYVERLDRGVILLRSVSQQATTLPIVAHEYIHCLFRIGDEDLIPWYNEGMAELFSTVEIENGSVVFGRPPPGRLSAIKQDELLPLDMLFTIDRRSPHLGAHNRAAPFYAESWALLHYFYCGENSLPRDKVEEFLRLAREPASVADPAKVRESCRRLLGVDYPELMQQMMSYLKIGKYRKVIFPLPAVDDPKTYAARIVPREEAHLRLAKLAFHISRDPVSKQVLKQAVDHAPLDPWIAEALAVDSMGEHDEGVTRAYWEKAIEAGTTNPAAFRELCLMENRKWFGRFNFDLRLEAEVTARIRKLLTRSITLFPQQYTAYEILAWVEAFAPTPDAGNVKLVADNFVLVKDRPRTLLALAVVAARSGDKSSAADCLDKIATANPPAAVVSQAKIIRDRLQLKRSLPLPATGK